MCRLGYVTLFLVAFLLLPPTSAACSTYTGTVVARGQPVVGATVYLRSYRPTSETEDVLVETRTDSQGRFTLTGPKEPDARPSEFITLAGDGRIGWFSLHRDETGEFAGPRIELYPVGEAGGCLTDSAGRPLPDVRLRVRSFGIRNGEGAGHEDWHVIPRQLSRPFETTTQADGTFILRGIPLGARVHASVSVSGYGDPDLFWTQGQAGDFRLERAGRIRLHFTGAANPRQLAGLALDVFTQPRSDHEDGKPSTNSLKSVKAKDQATLDIENVLPGRCVLRFHGTATVPYLPTQLPEFTVKPGELTEATLALEPAAHVRGRFINRQSKAGIAGLHIYAVSEGQDRRHQPGSWVSTTTDTEGRFTAHVRAGRVSVRLLQTPEGYASSGLTSALVRPVQVAGGAEHTFPDIVLEPAVVVEGFVVDPAGRPVSGTKVRTSEDAYGRSGQPRIVTDAHGGFVLSDLGVEDIIALRARNDRAVTDGGILVTVADQRGPIRLELSEKAACQVKGRVVDNLGKPVAGATARLEWHYRGVSRHSRMSFGAWLGVMKTDAEGRFHFGPLWPGDTYRVEVTAKGHAQAESIEVKGKAGAVQDLGVVLLPRTSAQVRGVVVDEAGQPLAGVTVFNHADAPEALTTATDKIGRFHLSGLYEGPAFVFARKEGYRFTMARTHTGTAEVRIVLLKTGVLPPTEQQPAQLKARREAEQKLLRHLLDQVLALSEAATGGYKRSVFECLARTDVAGAQKWLDNGRAAGGQLAPKDARRYLRALREAQAEQAAATDVDEALSLLPELDAEQACTTLRRLAKHFQTSEPGRSLRLAEEAAVKARALPLPNRVWELAAVGDLVVQLGQDKTGRKLLNEAADLAEKLGIEGLQEYARAEAARLLAPHDLPRARLLLRPMRDGSSFNEWLSRVAGELARTDPKAALALVDELKDDQSTVRDVTRLRIAWQTAARDPAEAARIAAAIPDIRYRAEGLTHVAISIARRDHKLACSLIDQALALYLDQPEPFRSWTNCGGRAVFAAWTAGEGQALGYPDPGSLVARALACQLSRYEAHSPVHALETKVRMAKVLALVDPVVAQQLLESVLPQQNLLGTGHTGFEKQDWLLARCLAGPERGPALVDDAIAKLDAKDQGAFYRSGLLQLAQVLSAPPEQRVRLVMGLNSGLLLRKED
jgi:hypothetical protein